MCDAPGHPRGETGVPLFLSSWRGWQLKFMERELGKLLEARVAFPRQRFFLDSLVQSFQMHQVQEQ